MQYFRINQDTDYLNAPVISDIIQQIDRRHTTREQAHNIAEITIFQLVSKEEDDFIDLLSRQLFLVSEPLKEAIRLYIPKLTFKMVILANHVQKQQRTYYLPIFEPIDCLSDKSIMTPDKSVIKKLVLKPSLMEKHSLFRVQHSYETIIIARLDAAESILRRNFRGIKLDRIELE